MTNVGRSFIIAATGASLLGSLGCATIVNGSRQNVSITSDPPRARAVVLPDKIELTTPADIDLSRTEVRTVRFELEGHEPKNGYLDRVVSNVVLGNLLVGGLIGMVVDMSSGCGFALSPDPLHVELKPIDGGDAASPSPERAHGSDAAASMDVDPQDSSSKPVD